MVKIFAVAMNRNRVPIKPRYFSGWRKPTSSICLRMLVTTISSRLCQREMRTSCARLRVTSLAPTASTSIKPQVVTMVRLSLIKPCCHKTISSVLRCMARSLSNWRPGQPDDDNAGNDEAEQTCQQFLPVVAGHKIKAEQREPEPQQQADDEPLRRSWRRQAFSHRPPQPAEIHRAEQHAGKQCQCQAHSVSHPSPPAPSESLCLLSRPNTTRSDSRRT